MSTDNERLTRPLAQTTEIIGLGLAAILIITGVTAVVSGGSFGGFGRGARSICATDPNIGTYAPQDPRTESYHPKAGSAPRWMTS